jgi:hypothetical protein
MGMSSPHSAKELAFRDTLASMLNTMSSEHSWANLARYAAYFHVDLDEEAEAEFAVQLNERIAQAAQALATANAAWPDDFEDMAAQVAGKIPELR